MRFSLAKRSTITRENVDEWSFGAAFSVSILQHNSIINSSSNIPPLCHTDEWCSNEPVPLSGYTAVICQLYAATCVCVWVRSWGEWRPSLFPSEYKEMMKWSLKEVWESRAKKREKGHQLVSSSKAPLLLLTAICVTKHQHINSHTHQASHCIAGLCTVGNSDATGLNLAHKLCSDDHIKLIDLKGKDESHRCQALGRVRLIAHLVELSPHPGCSSPVAAGSNSAPRYMSSPTLCPPPSQLAHCPLPQSLLHVFPFYNLLYNKNVTEHIIYIIYLINTIEIQKSHWEYLTG